MDSFKERMRRKELLVGGWLQLPDVFVTEIMAKAGFDWLAIDMEHGPLGMESVFKLIQVIDLAGTVPLVRLNVNDGSTIRRVMDAGARGVIVPMVNSPDDARRAVSEVKYPPAGKRSFGLGRVHEYGKKFKRYIESANSSSIVIIQIEHIDAIKNIDSILKVEGVDGVIIGPYDLSGSMGIPGEFENMDFIKTIDGLVKKIKRTDRSLGFHIVHPSAKELGKKVAAGFNFIGYGTDAIFLSNSLPSIEDLKKGKD